MKTVTITLTPDDIINGVPREYNNCAIALAIKRTLHVECHVGTKHITLYVFGKVFHRCILPTEATSFIHYFDRGIVGPHYQLSFPINVPNYLTYLAQLLEAGKIFSQVETVPAIETEPPADYAVVEEEEELVEVG